MPVKTSLFIYLLFLILIPGFTQARDFPPMPGQRYDVGGYSIHMLCRGQGTPTVIIDAGLGDDSTDWFNIQNRAAAETRVCVFDRPGYGWSDIGPQPRNSLHIAKELDKLIQKANLPGPYVLVGHSFGGYNVRVFASTHPHVIAGMVLVDASHENQYEQLGIKLPRHYDRKSNILILPKASGSISNKAGILRERAYNAARAEISSLYQSAQQVRHYKDLPSVPLIVISRGIPEWKNGDDGIAREKIWLKLQHDLWKLSPISQQLFAKHSGHDIQLEQPDLVVHAINDVVSMSRVMH